MKLMDRVAAGLDQFGRKAAQAIDETKLRMDIAGVRRRKDHAARDLGYLAYRQAKGEILPEGEAEVQVRRIAAAEEEIARLEAEMAAVRARDATRPAQTTGQPDAQTTGQPDAQTPGQPEAQTTGQPDAPPPAA